MLDLFDEFKALILDFTAEGLEYALCGGLAMAVYSAPRATVDIDIFTEEASLERVKRIAAKHGFDIEAMPMSFKEGAVQIRRFSKIDTDSRDVLSLDVLLATPETRDVWASRKEVEWEGGKLWVVSRDGLIKLKSMRGSELDKNDISLLEGIKDEG